MFLAVTTVAGLLIAGAAFMHPVGAAAATASAPAPAFNGFTWGSGPQTITVVNRARTGWNIRAAVGAWDRSPVVGVHWADVCDSHVSHCVFIDSGRYGPGVGWIGRTTSYAVPGTRQLSFVEIRLNDSQGFSTNYTAGSARGRSQAFSHEFGHALGLAHSHGASVMVQVVTGSAPYAESSDLRELAILYSAASTSNAKHS